MQKIYFKGKQQLKLCQQSDETVDSVISTCAILAKEQYIKRHDRVCAELHCNICKNIWVKLDNEHCCDHVPKSVETSRESKVNIWWNEQVQPDRNIPNNKPDIISRDNEEGTCVLTFWHQSFTFKF